jgi:hypothetical protein
MSKSMVLTAGMSAPTSLLPTITWEHLAMGTRKYLWMAESARGQNCRNVAELKQKYSME